jgi:hypothetical protein
MFSVGVRENIQPPTLYNILLLRVHLTMGWSQRKHLASYTL